MGWAKIFSFYLGKLFIVLAIRFISSQNNGFLLGVRPRDLWHLLRVSPAKRRQVFGKNQPAGQSKLCIYHLIERKQWNRLEEKKKFILQYKCKRTANYSLINKIVVPQRET